MSYSGLRTFLKGTDPYAPTLAKLRAWYAQTGEGRAMTPERARAMLAALVGSLPPERREEAVRELIARLVESYRAASAVPGWLEKLS